MYKQRELTYLERSLLLEKQTPGDEKTKLSWVDFPPTKLKLNAKGKRMNCTVGARGIFATGVPLTRLESEAFGFPLKNPDPVRVSLLFLSLPELLLAVKDYEYHEIKRARNKLIYPYDVDQSNKVMRQGYRLIVKRMFGREWNDSTNGFEGGTNVVDRLQDAVEANPDKEPLIICAHGAGKPKKYATPDGKAQELATHVWENLPIGQFSAILDSSCNYDGDIPNLLPARTPYFGIYGPTSLIQKRQSMVISNGLVEKYDASIDADVFLFSNLAVVKMVGYSILDTTLKLESGIDKLGEWRKKVGI